MTFYNEEVKILKSQLFANEHQLRQIIQAKHFIDRNFANDIDLMEISASANFSKFHFIRLFKKYYGRTPHQYLTDLRMAKAKELLAAGEKVADTCFALGYGSVSSFTALFKKMTGQSPSTFQQKKQFSRSD